MHNCLVKECGKEFESESSLHKHLKAHQIKVPDYYESYFPRGDKFDSSPIKFKNKDQYFNTDFNSRLNLKKWLQSVDKNQARTYCKELLVKRKVKKNLVWAPSQVELKASMLPPIQVYNDLFASYYALCEEIGLKNRFQDNLFLESNASQNYKILVDNREQLPLEFSQHQAEWATLTIGDYTKNKLDYRCYIERKSMGDMIGSLSGGYERFTREIERAKETEDYLIVLVEASLNDCLDFRSSPKFCHKNIQVTPEFVFFNVKELIQKYDNIQFLFVNGRKRAAYVVERIFDSGESYRSVDLQYQEDIGLL